MDLYQEKTKIETDINELENQRRKLEMNERRIKNDLAGTEEEIQEFCRLTYGVQFPMFEKTTVKSDDAHPFFTALAEASGTYPTWNFHKFLIGRDGELITEFSPRTKPYNDDVVGAIETALAN